MPYKRSYRQAPRRNYRKRTYARRPPQSQFQRYAGYASKALSLATKVAGLVNVEFKFIDQVTTDNPGTSVFAGQLLNGLTQGDTASTREGRQIRMKSVELMIRANLHASATRSTCRILLVLDKQANGSTMTAAQCLENTSVGNVDAMRNLDNRKRFVILMDKRFVLNSDYPEKAMHVYKKLDIKTIYNSLNNGNVGDINSNALFVWTMSDETVNVPAITINSRLRWIDN